MLKKLLRGLGITVAFVVLSFFSYLTYDSVMYGETAYSGGQEDIECNVVGLDLHGTIATYIPVLGSADDPEEYQNQYGDAVASEDIVAILEEAEQNDQIKGVMLDIESSGGYAISGEEIANALKEMTKPTVAVIRGQGLSAAYWAATGADKIFASRNSDVGSIGVTQSYVEYVGKNEEEGLKYVQLSAGKFKDAGDPDKPLTEEEKAIFVRDLKIMHENFIQDVAVNRKLAVERVTEIADGSSVLGEKAKELELIDEIGSWTEAEKYLEDKVGEKTEI